MAVVQHWQPHFHGNIIQTLALDTEAKPAGSGPSALNANPVTPRVFHICESDGLAIVSQCTGGKEIKHT